MTNNDPLISRYNYNEFVPSKFEPWLNFSSSPQLGIPVPDFPLWHLDGSKTSLSDIWSQNIYTVVEFGSFT